MPRQQTAQLKIILPNWQFVVIDVPYSLYLSTIQGNIKAQNGLIGVARKAARFQNKDAHGYVGWDQIRCILQKPPPLTDPADPAWPTNPQHISDILPAVERALRPESER